MTDWQHANLTAVMTNIAAPLVLNPGGGDVGINRPGSVLLSQLDMNGAITTGTDSAQRGQYGYGSVAYNANVAPGTSQTAADTILHSFDIGVNQYNIWAYGTAGNTSIIQKMMFSEVNGGTTPFEIWMDGSWQSRQVARATSGSTGPRTFAAADCGTYVRDTATATHTDTVPSGLPIGCTIDVIQAGSGGTITFAAGSGGTVEQNGSGTLSHTTNGQFALATIVVDSSSTFLLSGQVK